MKLEVTEKDIQLLKILISVLIVFMLLRFAILPGIETAQEQQAVWEKIQQKVDDMQNDIDSISRLEAEIEEEKLVLEEISSDYYELLENQNIDELVTGIVMNNGLFPVSLRIMETVPEILEPYHTYSAEKTETQIADNYLYIGRVQMVVLGAEEDIWKMLDDIEENYQAVRLTEFDIEEKTYVDSTMEIVQQTKMTCTLEIYMHDDIITEDEA